MNRFRTLTLIGFALCSLGARADEVMIANGDTDALMAALNTNRLAPERPHSRVIHLAPGGRYLFLKGTIGAYVETDIRLEANGAQWTGRTSARIVIDQHGSLEINALNVRAIHLVLNGFFAGFPPIPQIGAPWISNSGNLAIRNSSFTDVTIENEQLGLRNGLIGNGGGLRMENVTVSGLRYRATSGLNIEGALLLSSSLDARLSNLTITENGGSAPALFDATHCPTKRRCSFELANSILVHNSLPLCIGEVTSLGNNIFGDDSCTARMLSDRIRVNLQLRKLRTDLGPVAVHPLRPDSEAIDAAGQGRCPERDALGTGRTRDGDGDGIGICDIGAFERPAPPQPGPGLLNGLFFEPAADGHYVQLQETAPGRYIVFWSTFDQDGRSAWIFATGARTGTHIQADAFISQGGRFHPGGAPHGQQVVPWGHVEVDMQSCRKGTFRYQSIFPEFGSGEFSLDRLAFVHELGCR